MPVSEDDDRDIDVSDGDHYSDIDPPIDDPGSSSGGEDEDFQLGRYIICRVLHKSLILVFIFTKLIPHHTLPTIFSELRRLMIERNISLQTCTELLKLLKR